MKLVVFFLIGSDLHFLPNVYGEAAEKRGHEVLQLDHMKCVLGIEDPCLL